MQRSTEPPGPRTRDSTAGRRGKGKDAMYGMAEEEGGPMRASTGWNESLMAGMLRMLVGCPSHSAANSRT